MAAKKAPINIKNDNILCAPNQGFLKIVNTIKAIARGTVELMAKKPIKIKISGMSNYSNPNTRQTA